MRLVDGSEHPVSINDLHLTTRRLTLWSRKPGPECHQKLGHVAVIPRVGRRSLGRQRVKDRPEASGPFTERIDGVERRQGDEDAVLAPVGAPGQDVQGPCDVVAVAKAAQRLGGGDPHVG